MRRLFEVAIITGVASFLFWFMSFFLDGTLKFNKNSKKPQNNTKVISSYNFSLITCLIVLVIVGIYLYLRIEYLNYKNTVSSIAYSTPTPYVTVTLIPTKYIPSNNPQGNNQGSNDQEWGTVKQVGDNTFRLKVAKESRMSTPQELYEALNIYRRSKGVNTLSWDDNLAKIAQDRANNIYQAGQFDDHKGFQDIANNFPFINGIGFRQLGENATTGYILSGQHLVEWAFGGDAPHDENQIDSRWTHVGVGIDDSIVIVIFGKHGP